MFKKFLMAKSLMIFVLPFMLYADTCIVASGQTRPFTLTPGAKAAWNKPISGVHQRNVQSLNGGSFSVYQLPDGAIGFKTPGIKNDALLKISLFSVSGRKISAAEMDGRTSGVFAKKLVPGIYLARLDADGIIKTTRFMVGR
jgi:hypothetical protein